MVIRSGGGIERGSKPSDGRKEGKMLGGLSADTIIVVGLMVAAVLFIIWLRRQ
jgi:hypothetical protein